MKKAIFIILALILVLVFIFCNFLDKEKEILLQPIKTVSLTVPEPSGLYYDESDKTLWTVSDETSKIYNIDLAGNIIAEILVNGLDLEGIERINDSTLVTILERDRTIVFLDLKGNEINRIKLDLKGEPNKGLEGISYNAKDNMLYVVNEKDPGLLLFIDSTGSLIKQKDLDYTSDLSGLEYVESTNNLWIISDEENAIMKCSEDGTLINKYKVDVEQIEGIAIDTKNKLLFIVSDPLEKMYTYRLP